MGDTFRFGRLYKLFDYEVYLGEALLSMAALCLTALFCARFKKSAAKAMIALAALFCLGIVVVLLGTIFRVEHSLTPAFVPDASAISQIVRIAVISPWAFIGFESISHSAEEFSFNHNKTFRIFVITVVSVTALYVMILLLSVTAYPPEYDSWLAYIRDLNHQEGLAALPAFYAARHYLGNAGVTALMIALMALIITSLIGNLTELSRLFYSLGRDQLLPSGFGDLNRQGVPAKAILLIVCLSLLISFLGRTAIGWIVDVTTIGATIIYAYVSAAAHRQAVIQNDRKEMITGAVGFALMTVYLLYLLLPNLISQGSMAKESYFLFIVWSILGFLFFRSILHRDHEYRFGKSVIVWMVLLALVLFIALIWMRQSMISSDNLMMTNIHAHYQTAVEAAALRLADEQFIGAQLEELEKANTRTILMATGMFAFALMIMLSNYSFMSKQTKESQKIANTDAMTGVKSKHAFLKQEEEINAELQRGTAKEFALAVCDVNGLKFINDTFGHKAGDDYIRAASAMICDLFQHSPVFRTGGDEFVVILKGRDYQSRGEIMEELYSKSKANIGTDQVVISAGLSEYHPGDQNIHAVFERADQLMYQNKQALKQMGAKTR